MVAAFAAGGRIAAVGVALVLAVAVGYSSSASTCADRYADPSFTTPGLNAAFRWARSVEDARIATTSTRQYPLFGTDLSNTVEFIGEGRPHGGFVAPATCRAWRRLLDRGRLRLRDHQPRPDRTRRSRPTPKRPAGPKAPAPSEILRKPPTVIFKLTGSLNPSACPELGPSSAV